MDYSHALLTTSEPYLMRFRNKSEIAGSSLLSEKNIPIVKLDMRNLQYDVIHNLIRSYECTKLNFQFHYPSIGRQCSWPNYLTDC
jgi:hypothetical protein